MLDAAKATWVANPPTGLSTGTPIIHLYPDWYGPFRESQNQLFTLGTNPNVTGPWAPIGIKDMNCDPDSGCHNAHHCMTVEDAFSWESGYGNSSHETKADSQCRTSGVVPPGATWTWGESYYIAQRYVVAYASCMGGVVGSYYQSWVNGKDREFDDSGTNGHLCTRDGFVDATCGSYATKSSCLAAPASYGCHWAEGEDGSVIRINNGQRVTEYGASADRYYTSDENYDPQTGAFDERTETLSASPSNAKFIRCSSGHGTF